MQKRLIIQTLSACADMIDKVILKDGLRGGITENDTFALREASRNISNVISYIHMGDGDHKLKTIGLVLLGIFIGLILSPALEAIFRVFS